MGAQGRVLPVCQVSAAFKSSHVSHMMAVRVSYAFHMVTMSHCLINRSHRSFFKCLLFASFPILSVNVQSLDRTTRLHGQYRRAHCSPTSTTSSNVERTLATWHELARPQSHGYDLSAVAWLDRLSFASAADEKVVRIFAAPQGFVDSAHQLGTVQDERPKVRGSNDRFQTSLQHGGPSADDGHAVKQHTVLAFNLPTLGHVRSPTHLRSPIEYATRNSKSRLLILACTPLLDDVALGAAPKLSFQDAEKLLKWCYAQAWAVAVAEERFLLQIDVLLVPLEHAPDTCRRWAREEAGLETFYVVKGELLLFSPRNAEYEAFPS